MNHPAHCSHDQQELERTEDFFERHNIQSVKILWCDLHGIARGKVISRKKFYDELHRGITFSLASLYMDLRGDVVDLDNKASQTGWTSCHACPELDSLRLSPTEASTAEVLAHLHQDSCVRVPGLPREALQQVLRRAEEMSFQVHIGSELEFYLLQDEASTLVPPGKNCYRLLQGRDEKRFMTAVHETLERSGLNFEASMSEDGPGQFEIVLYPSPALEHADQVFRTKTAIKSLAAERGLTATFLSKPVAGESGSGYHIHHTLNQRDDARSLFDESAFDTAASRTIESFTAGQLAYLPGLSAFLLPTVNSYKRIRTRGPRPLSLTWGEDNRTVAVRIMGRGTADARVENRVAAGECNPYLAIAASIAAGVQGLTDGTSLPAAITGNAFEGGDEGSALPANLGQALDLLEQSSMARDWFSEELISHFIALKRSEWERYLRAVTDWEKQEYLAFL